MNDARKKIFKFIQKLQIQTHLPLWKLANEKVCYAAATGENIEWGPKIGLLRRIMKIADKIYATDIIIFFLGLIRAFSIWWKIKKATLRTSQKNKFKKIFAGFGASSEEYLYAEYIRQTNDPVLRINWTSHDGICELGCPSLISILNFVTRNAFGYTAQLKNSIQETSTYALDFIAIYAVNLGTYAFYHSFWKKAKSQGVNEVAVLALDIPAHACVDAGINTVYLQHGLMALSIPVPAKLHRIDVLTVDEESYLKTTLNNVKIVRATKIIKDNNPKNNILMILSINFSHKERLSICETLIEWANKMGLQILIRPTPNVTQNELTDIQRRLPQAQFDNLRIPLDSSLEKWRPKFVAAWTSTGLATALDYGCLPITLYHPDLNRVWNNIIYPMKNRLLFWPRDVSLLETALQNENAYDAQLKNLRSYHENYSDSLHEILMQ